ncbi:MAG: hypothetical protein WCG78_04650, partial [Candidatus Omnitrophota bacterium]
LAPDDPEAHYALGLSYAYLDKKAMAYREFTKVIALVPEKPIARNAKEAIASLQKFSSIKSLPYQPLDN